ncbi:hypothetical protein C3D80_19790 [Cronobacter sakazakii]|uniref:hypothetical protein n=1 Tax=Cronobacter sakazakii TaxID=28141 RepID=UPI000CF173BC|nr:hypothetical protein [Cronobacter sakazakii]ELY2519808.1 hypothetical protein [Cronobacter sakazakii]ELY2708118.1 hypothetical protein [Cronobacter sakazakii]ELY3705192.1 hypothetical protein [Cronobacter sakazakii]ELY4570457.1 hypothetical protein [Cronobacter sakazakii]EMC4149925.1 hypothetical protein [Cronobacter sakazakii]
MDKSREQFLDWFSKEYEEVNNSTELSAQVIKMIASAAWLASRAAVEIELPNGVTTREALDAGYTCDYAAGMDDGIEGCEDAILAAGLKVKGE